jgi:hypothetical protein
VPPRDDALIGASPSFRAMRLGQAETRELIERDGEPLAIR